MYSLIQYAFQVKGRAVFALFTAQKPVLFKLFCERDQKFSRQSNRKQLIAITIWSGSYVPSRTLNKY